MKRFISIFFAHKVLFARKKFFRLFSFLKEIPRLFYKVSLPGDCHASLAMTEYFVRNITSVCLPETICKIFVLSLFYPVQRTLCHCEALPTAMPWQSPGRDTLLTPRKILLYLRGEKGAHKQKSEHCRPRQCDFKSAVCAAGQDNTTAVAVVLSFDVF